MKSWYIYIYIVHRTKMRNIWKIDNIYPRKLSSLYKTHGIKSLPCYHVTAISSSSTPYGQSSFGQKCAIIIKIFFDENISVPLKYGNTYVRQWTGSSLVRLMAWCMFGAKLLPEPNNFVNWAIWDWPQWNLNSSTNYFLYEITFEIIVCGKWYHSVLVWMYSFFKVPLNIVREM